MAKSVEQLMAGDNLTGSSSLGLNGMMNDLSQIYMESSKYTMLMARNAVSTSPVGDFLTLSNEMSNRLVATAPYTIIGCIYIHNGQWAIFSTDDTNCEIGIFDEAKQEYEGFVNSTDLNFKKSHLIKGVGRIRKYCHRTVYWDDDLNPSRQLDFDDIKWSGLWAGKDCKEFRFKHDSDLSHQDPDRRYVNYDELQKTYRILDTRKCRLQLTTTKGLNIKASISGHTGELQNGTYAFVGAYSLGQTATDKNLVTNFYNMSNRVVVFNHNDLSGAIELEVDPDEDFEEYSIYVLKFINQNLDVRYLGSYSTAVKSITITQLDLSSPVLPTSEIFTEYDVPERTAGIYKAGDYIIRKQPTLHQNFNYQPMANKIKTYWVSVRYGGAYYRNGGTNVGYMRDEVYSFFIRWVYDTGDKSLLYHIPCNVSNVQQNEDNLSYVPGTDIKLNEMLADGGVVKQIGATHPYISEELYDDKKPEVWAELCGKNIRHHTMPSNTVSPHFDGDYINVLGVCFTNIERPKKIVGFDDNGNPIEKYIDNIIGYEIYRGSRVGNKSIIAKGIINNMHSYVDQFYEKNNIFEDIENKQIYFQNYPYNNSDEVFITQNKYIYRNNNKYEKLLVDNDGKLGRKYGNSLDMFTFHTPDLKHIDGQASNAYLSAKDLKVYGFLSGHMKDISFFEPDNAPKFKLLNTTGLLMSAILGIGYALQKVNGKKKTIVNQPKIKYGGTLTIAGVATGSQGMGGPSAFSSLAQSLMSIATNTVIRGLIEGIEQTGRIAASVAGINLDKATEKTSITTGELTSAATGAESSVTTEREETPNDMIPMPLRLANAIPLFITNWTTSTNDLLEMLYSTARYNSFLIQQVSHGDYEKFNTDSNVYPFEKEIKGKTWLGSDGTYTMESPDGMRYINNMYRPACIGLHTAPILNSEQDIGSQLLYSKWKNNNITIKSFYTALKQPLNRQYGQLDNIKPVIASDALIKISDDNVVNNSSVIFGGDTFINKYSEKNTMFFFTNEAIGMPDGTPFNYFDHKAVSNPRYWLNSQKFEIGDAMDVIGKILARDSYSDFEPFKFATRFNTSEINYKAGKDNYSMNNFETSLSKENYDIREVDETNPAKLEEALNNIDNKKYSDIYTQYYQDLKDYVKLHHDFNDKNANDDEVKDLADEFLANVNDNRSCSCLWNRVKDIKVSYNESFANNLRAVRNKTMQSDYDINEFTLIYGQDDIEKEKIKLYDRKNIISPINCEFFKYTKGSNQDSSSQFINTKRNLDTDDLFYQNKFRLKESEFDKLCKLTHEIERAQFDYAIALGYVKFLQMTVDTNEGDNDDDDDEGNESENRTVSCMCWTRDKHDEEQSWKKVKEQTADSFDDPWNDDYTDQDFYFQWNGYICGSYNNIPYTMHPKILNPLLAYFISEETDVDLHYPTRDELIQNWKGASNDISMVLFDKLGITSKYDTTEEAKNTINSENYNSYPFAKVKDNGWFFSEKIFENFSDWKDYINDNGDENTEQQDIEYFGYAPNGNSLKGLSKSEAIKLIIEKGKQEKDNKLDINTVMSIIQNLKNESYDDFFTGDNYYDYWTLDYARKTLYGKNYTKSKKLRKIGGYFCNTKKKIHDGGTESPWDKDKKQEYEVVKAEKCEKIQKYFSDGKGKIKRRLNKLEKQINKLTKKYDKTLKKMTKNYEKSQKKSSLMNNIKTAINENFNPGSYFNLDLKKTNKVPSKYRLFIDGMCMYTYISGVRDFYVESERNVSARQWGNPIPERFYSDYYYNDLRTMFASDIIRIGEKFMMERQYVPEYAMGAFYGAGFANRAPMQSRLYDPIEAYTCQERLNNRIMYSMPDKDTNISDGWRVFRLNNHIDFKDTVTKVMQKGNELGAVVLFENTSPVEFKPMATLDPNTASLISTYGDGSLFNKQNMRNITQNDSFENMSCDSEYSAISTPAGIYYVSNTQGRIFNDIQFPKDISSMQSYMSMWFKKFIPYMLLKDKEVFSDNDFDLMDNPVDGIGMQTSYDQALDIVYFSKKDYMLKEDKKNAKYLGVEKADNENKGRGKFIDLDTNRYFYLGDPDYFDDASFTLSLDRKKGENGWLSFHDWHPDLTMSSTDRIYSTKGNGIYRHNDSPKSYCNFYGQYYPFEVEFQLTTKNTVSTLKSVSYFMETFVYANNGYDRNHTLYDNFDKAIIYNTEQISGQLNLIRQKDSDPLMSVEYPKLTKDKSSYDILWSKEEQRYRFNQFWDITKNRMDRETMFLTEPNGYIRHINPKYVDYMKSDFERKKFRHSVNNIKLSRTTNENNGDVNMVFSVSLNRNLTSFR